MFCSMIKYFAVVLVITILIDGAPTGRFNFNENDALDQILQDQSEIEKNSAEINSEKDNENPSYDANDNVSEHKRQMEFISKYHDYELDTTDTDQFNEEDQILRAYYGRRFSLFDDYADSKSFADVMRADAGPSRRDTTLHYGGYMSDESANQQREIDVNEDYENYDNYY